jgi:hypothetical protein
MDIVLRVRLYHKEPRPLREKKKHEYMSTRSLHPNFQSQLL